MPCDVSSRVSEVELDCWISCEIRHHPVRLEIVDGRLECEGKSIGQLHENFIVLIYVTSYSVVVVAGTNTLKSIEKS